jgi:hypothetical protein
MTLRSALGMRTLDSPKLNRNGRARGAVRPGCLAHPV